MDSAVNVLRNSPNTSDLSNTHFFQLNLRGEYMHSAVDVLKNSPKISDQTKTEFFQLNLSQIHGNIL